MPGRNFGRRRGYRGLSLRPVNSTKNTVYVESPIGTTIITHALSNAVDAPVIGTDNAVERSSTIKAIWLSVDVCGLAGTGVLQTTSFYLMHNPGNNLTEPNPRTEGQSNEKKFIFKTWNAMTMRSQDGNVPYHWEGWIKVPRKMQRQGQDDRFTLSHLATTAAGHMSIFCTYKWYK